MAVPTSARPGSTTAPAAPAQPLPILVLVAFALVGMVVAGAVGGAFQALVGFSDGGPIARYGLPVARAIHDAFGALTVGLLLLAGTMIPDTGTTRRRETACRWATVTGTVWALAGLSVMLLLISNVSGIAVTDSGFLAQVVDVTWKFDFFRVFFISVLIAVGATVLAAVARTKNSMAWAAALSILAFAPLALAGHSGGAAAHDTAVNSLAVHLVSAAVWAGGLAAILVLWRVLGSAAGVVVRRYSVLAAWCLGGIAVSGVLNGAVRVGEFSALTSTYGILLIVKAVLLVILGIAGYRMRSHIVTKLDAGDGPMGAAFRRLALVEIAVMAAAMGIGVGLSRSPTPVPRRPPDADPAIALTGYPAPAKPLEGMDWFTVMRPDWIWVAVAVLGTGLYVAAVIRLHRRGDSWPCQRTTVWVIGWLLFLWATSGAPGVYGKIEFSTHMFMHMMLTMGIPIFLSQAAPLTLAMRALPARHDKTLGPRELLLSTAHSRWLNFFCNPVVASINFVGSLYVFYFTGLFELALRTHTGHVAMVIHFMLAGYVFCWSLIGIDPGPKRFPPAIRLVALFATMSFHAFFGVAIMSGKTVLGGDFFHLLRIPWNADLLADQQDGGGITWGIGEFPMLYLALLTALTWMRADEHDAKRLDRQADRDHDAALTAYNEELHRRAELMKAREQAWEADHHRRS